ncbi:hypothetical protein PR048_007689 [Dryococelus australis]|uniref:G-protein coupled receptors family 1 profile domain-containing protein n=1 Tax=Dryococelus australis TaxID=614101 RepID=A0ABQ9HVC6_9NEOP|nr:hypothetical protein PR048_007689 [Dryococelus australis]
MKHNLQRCSRKSKALTQRNDVNGLVHMLNLPRTRNIKGVIIYFLPGIEPILYIAVISQLESLIGKEFPTTTITSPTTCDPGQAGENKCSRQTIPSYPGTRQLDTYSKERKPRHESEAGQQAMMKDKDRASSGKKKSDKKSASLDNRGEDRLLPLHHILPPWLHRVLNCIVLHVIPRDPDFLKNKLNIDKRCFSKLSRPLAGGFSQGIPVPPALSFQRRSILGSHFMLRSVMTGTYGSRLESPAPYGRPEIVCNPTTIRGRGGQAVSPLASHKGEPGSVLGLVTGLSHVGIVPDDAVGRQVFSGISRFHPPFHSGTAPYSPQSPSSALKTSLLRAVQISSPYYHTVSIGQRLQANIITIACNSRTDCAAGIPSGKPDLGNARGFPTFVDSQPEATQRCRGFPQASRGIWLAHNYPFPQLLIHGNFDREMVQENPALSLVLGVIQATTLGWAQYGRQPCCPSPKGNPGSIPGTALSWAWFTQVRPALGPLANGNFYGLSVTRGCSQPLAPGRLHHEDLLLRPESAGGLRHRRPAKPGESIPADPARQTVTPYIKNTEVTWWRILCTPANTREQKSLRRPVIGQSFISQFLQRHNEVVPTLRHDFSLHSANEGPSSLYVRGTALANSLLCSYMFCDAELGAGTFNLVSGSCKKMTIFVICTLNQYQTFITPYSYNSADKGGWPSLPLSLRGDLLMRICSYVEDTDIMKRCEYGAAQELKGAGYGKSHRKPGTIPTCENTGVTRPGIEVGSPWWEASRLSAQPPRPRRRTKNILPRESSEATDNNEAFCKDSYHHVVLQTKIQSTNATLVVIMVLVTLIYMPANILLLVGVSDVSGLVTESAKMRIKDAALISPFIPFLLLLSRQTNMNIWLGHDARCRVFYPTFGLLQSPFTLMLPAHHWLSVKRGVSKELPSNRNGRRNEQVYGVYLASE